MACHRCLPFFRGCSSSFKWQRSSVNTLKLHRLNRRSHSLNDLDYGRLDSIFTAVDQYMPNSVSIPQVPAISNLARGSSPKILGGYLSVKPRELLASYMGCWQQAADHP